MAKKGDDYPKVFVRIAEGRPSSLTKCKNRELAWSSFCKRLAEPTRSRESLKRYFKLPLEEQSRLKAADGWVVGGPIEGGRRRKANIRYRDVIAIDCDGITEEQLFDLLNGLAKITRFEFVLHSTRKHTEKKPRVRLFLLLAEPIPADLYEPLTRILAEMIDPSMDGIDDVSFRASQLMYWPTLCADSEYVFHHNRGVPVDAHAVLGAYLLDWRDFANLPYSELRSQARRKAYKAENPLEKKGVIGAFCRAYDVEAAIAAFLPDVYTPGESISETRYTYAEGSVANGAIVYEDGLFLYSHHDTDPVGHQLVNAFDLVRIHKFGREDDGKSEDIPVTRQPSFKAMRGWVKELEPVLEELVADFDDFDRGSGATGGGGQEGAEGDEDAAKIIADLLGGTKKSQPKNPLDRMNQRHAVVRMGGKTVIAEFVDKRVEFGPFRDLQILYRNKRIDGQPIADWWLDHPKRRTYGDGVVFHPGGSLSPKVLNLWTGWAVEPNPNASCELILNHIHEVICAGDPEAERYVLGWMADMVQNPGVKPGVALVLKGLKGAGKDTLGSLLGIIVGSRHVAHILHPDQLTGRFNAHFMSALLAHVEEVFWAGSKSGVGTLQSLITSPYQSVEKKGMDIIRVRSFLRLLMTTNEDWAVPATAVERRYAVFDVSNHRRNDSSYFKPLLAQIQGEGAAGFFAHLLDYDLSDFDVRGAPQTEGLLAQKLASLQNVERWWYDILCDGEFPSAWNVACDPEDRGWDESPIEVKRTDLRELYGKWLRSQSYQGAALHAGLFGRRISEMCPEKEDTRPRSGADEHRPKSYRFPPLRRCRELFNQMLDGNLDTLQWGGEEADEPDREDIL